jgi:hypothetical protein
MLERVLARRVVKHAVAVNQIGLCRMEIAARRG